MFFFQYTSDIYFQLMISPLIFLYVHIANSSTTKANQLLGRVGRIWMFIKVEIEAMLISAGLLQAFNYPLLFPNETICFVELL